MAGSSSGLMTCVTTATTNPQHAPSFFRRFLDKMETLDVIPSGCEQFERQYYGPERPEIVRFQIPNGKLCEGRLP